MTSWDERFRDGSYPQDPEPSPVLAGYLPNISTGRALDVATGTGRNAVYLATEGYTVDAIDQSREGLGIARDTATQRAVSDRINWIQADATTFDFPPKRYDLITISFFRCLDRLSDIKASLAAGGYLFIEHHLRSTESALSGPSSDRYRFTANELLHACLDLTICHYDEGIERREDENQRATARVLARNTTGQRQSYPKRPSLREQIG